MMLSLYKVYGDRASQIFFLLLLLLLQISQNGDGSAKTIHRAFRIHKSL